jgi:hypothetical protein
MTDTGSALSLESLLLMCRAVSQRIKRGFENADSTRLSPGA